ncbi:MAG: hypothetical protein R2726_00240 [Acidimicrobiales bacterium]
MRLLQLNPNGSEASALDLHPMISVVTGLGPSGRDTVLRAVQALPRGDDPGCAGLVEAHGVLLDLAPDALRLLGLEGDLDVVLRRADLPDHAPGSDEAVASRPSIDHFLEETPVGVDAELDGARRAQRNAREALAVLEEAAVAARAKYDDVAARKRRTEAALAAASAPTAPHLRLVTDAETGEKVASDETDLDELRRHRAELAERITDLDERVAHIDRSLEELSAIDTRPLVVLLEAIKNPQPIEYVPSERAHELADEFVELQGKVDALEAEMEAKGRGPASALKRLEECRAELAAAEKAMRKPELGPDDIAELEAAHEAVLEAEKKASGGLRKKGGQKALEEAQRHEQEVLDRVGFPTWSAYVMGAGLLAIDHAAEQRLERARFDVEAAEATWAQISEDIEADPEHKRLLDRLQSVYLEAYDLLGGEEPDDLERALRELQVPKREVTTEELADALAYQLELVGLALGPSPTVDLTVMAAEAFVEEAAAIDGRVTELTEEKHRAVAERDVAVAQLDELPDVPDLPESTEPGPAGPGSEAPAGADQVDEADDFASFAAFETADEGDEPVGSEPTAAEGGDDSFAAFPSLVGEADDGGPAPLSLVPDDELGLAEEEPIAQEAHAADLAALERELEEATEEEAEYREWVESREALLDAAIQVETVATSRLMRVAADLLERGRGGGDAADDLAGGADDDEAAVEFYLLSRLGALRSVSFAGSVPLAIDDALAGRPVAEVERLLAKLEQMAASVQILYLSDDPTVVDWAERAGFERAAVVAAPAAFSL